MAKFVMLFMLVFVSNTVYSGVELSPTELESIGNKIYLNETGGNAKYLVAWNEGEQFASLGIGHFIWFPANTQHRFTETFPDLIEFLKAKGVTIPAWLNESNDCPWTSKKAFEQAKSSEKMNDLYLLLQTTFQHQVEFIFQRMKKSLPLMVLNTEDLAKQQKLQYNFSQLSNSALGMYTLIDYVNFKGEGIADSERYKGQGWGLKQVLLNIDSSEKSVHQAFTQSCITVLTNRVNNSPQKEIEQKWLAGWSKRCQTYSN